MSQESASDPSTALDALKMRFGLGMKHGPMAL